MRINTRDKQHKKVSIRREYKQHKLGFWRNLKRRQLRQGEGRIKKQHQGYANYSSIYV